VVLGRCAPPHAPRYAARILQRIADLGPAHISLSECTSIMVSLQRVVLCSPTWPHPLPEHVTTPAMHLLGQAILFEFERLRSGGGSAMVEWAVNSSLIVHSVALMAARGMLLRLLCSMLARVVGCLRQEEPLLQQLGPAGGAFAWQSLLDEAEGILSMPESCTVAVPTSSTAWAK
jgi:hypothetical protein